MLANAIIYAAKLTELTSFTADKYHTDQLYVFEIAFAKASITFMHKFGHFLQNLYIIQCILVSFNYFWNIILYLG